MIVREMKNGFNRGEKFLGCTRFPECRGTAVITSNDMVGQEFETEPAFTDSWENRSWQNDDTQSRFTDRAFQ